ncbi:DNA-directed RNA polymerases IV and V subunit 2-like [Olea europaea subsp. europaea]|uniref:DNA-directed RNA polymerase n=1 Tax=Olea europaea subsp. europaea TaxID=158383 RepID=A0A8S0V1G6_OLEEU|nr:DNA-directed RNA polymerases IV and V subunit 2-like [Olea europaea subsp. europaea]
MQGIVPDIEINPHAFPSRQTPDQLLEAALGKGIALGSALKYATPFSTPPMEAVQTSFIVSIELIRVHLTGRLGFSRWGNDRVYDGHTGEMVRSLVFMGPTFYQRLTHIAEDKVKFRNTGPVHPLTRQPVANRKRFGGIKFGEIGGRKIRGPYCRFCESVEHVVKANVPYGAKLLCQELY